MTHHSTSVSTSASTANTSAATSAALHAAPRDAMCLVGRSLFERGYLHGTAGNISVRLDGDAGFLITPTDACLGFLQPDTLAHVELNGAQLSGAPASKTLALHRRIYDAEPAAHCVLHSHSTHLVALTLAGVWHADAVLPPITPYFVMKVGRVPLLPYLRPGDPAMAEAVALAIVAAQQRQVPIRAVLCERLGPVVWHHSPQAAMAALEELEETAKLWLMSQPRSQRAPSPLDDAAIDDLRQRFGAVW